MNISIFIQDYRRAALIGGTIFEGGGVVLIAGLAIRQGLLSPVAALLGTVTPNQFCFFVALGPSVSLAVFGLTLPEVLLGGGKAEIKALLHRLHLYRWGNCACHKMTKAPA